MSYDYEVFVPEFNLRNDSLVSLASEAAVDIVNFMDGRSQEDKSVQYLSYLLNEATQGDNPRALFPDNSVVLGNAISGRKRFDNYWRGKDASELLMSVNLVAKDLRDFKNLSRERQETLTGFCVDLSREIANNYIGYYSGKYRLVA